MSIALFVELQKQRTFLVEVLDEVVAEKKRFVVFNGKKFERAVEVKKKKFVDCAFPLNLAEIVCFDYVEDFYAEMHLRSELNFEF